MVHNGVIGVLVKNSSVKIFGSTLVNGIDFLFQVFCFHLGKVNSTDIFYFTLKVRFLKFNPLLVSYLKLTITPSL